MSLTGEDAVTLLWDPEQLPSWSYLALASPHAHTQLDLVHSTGSAMAVLGASLLLTRIATADRLLRPVRLAGAMTLTLYSAHILVLATGLFEDDDLLLYLVLVVGSMVFATLWRRWRAQGPLEELVGRAAGRARRAVLGRTTHTAAGDRRGPLERLGVIGADGACRGVLDASSGERPDPGRATEPAEPARSTAAAP